MRYAYRIEGLAGDGEFAELFRRIRQRFEDLSALDDGDGRAENRSGIQARARQDRQLLLDILSGEGFFDATVDLSVDRSGEQAQPVTLVLS